MSDAENTTPKNISLTQVGNCKIVLQHACKLMGVALTAKHTLGQHMNRGETSALFSLSVVFRCERLLFVESR